jgi:hypothetical protein
MILVRLEKSGETGSAFAWSDAVSDDGGAWPLADETALAGACEPHGAD